MYFDEDLPGEHFKLACFADSTSLSAVTRCRRSGTILPMVIEVNVCEVSLQGDGHR